MIALLDETVVGVMLAFCRLGACLAVIPGVSGARVPPQVRLLFAIVFTLAIAPLSAGPDGPAMPDTTAELARSVVAETSVGLAIGLAARLFVLAMSFAATAIAMSIGLGGIPGTVLADAEPQDPLAAYLSTALLATFFAADLHHLVLGALMATYVMVPAGTGVDPRVLLASVADVVAQSFSIALRLASPFLAYAILANLTVGLLNKLSPQVPVYFVMLPLLMFGGLWLLATALPGLLSLAGDGLRDVMAAMPG